MKTLITIIGLLCAIASGASAQIYYFSDGETASQYGKHYLLLDGTTASSKQLMSFKLHPLAGR